MKDDFIKFDHKPLGEMMRDGRSKMVDETKFSSFLFDQNNLICLTINHLIQIGAASIGQVHR